MLGLPWGRRVRTHTHPASLVPGGLGRPPSVSAVPAARSRCRFAFAFPALSLLVAARVREFCSRQARQATDVAALTSGVVLCGFASAACLCAPHLISRVADRLASQLTMHVYYVYCDASRHANNTRQGC